MLQPFAGLRRAICRMGHAGTGPPRGMTLDIVMKIVLKLSVTASVLALCSTGVSAQSEALPESEEADAQTIIVTANRTQRAISQVGESVTVIGQEEIVKRQPTEVLDMLRTVPGVTFHRSGGIGTSSGVSIRGAQSDQTVVLIDGVKLNDPASPGGGFNFGPLMTGNIAGIEVVRGSQSVLYGSQAIGGVVNLITREPTQDVGVFARAEYGERDTIDLIGNLSGKFGRLSASIGGNYFKTDGISAFSEARGGTEPDGFESIGVNGKLDIALSENVSIDLRGFYADSETDVDGFGATGLQDTLEVSFDANFVGYAGINANFLDGRFRNRIGIAYTDIDRRSVDFTGGGNTETFAANGQNLRYEYQGVLDAAEIAQLVFGVEREESEYLSSSFGGPAAGAEVWINSLYGQLNLSPIEGLSLTGGLRYDDHETFGGNTTLALSGAYSPDGGNTVLRGSFSEGFKAPALFQLFSDFGNPALDPEESQSWDVGITHSFLDGKAQIGATYFERDAENLITFVGCFENPLPPCQVANPPFGTYDNIALASAEGWELQLALRPADDLDVAINYTNIDSRNDITGNRQRRVADETISLVADYRHKTGLALGVTVFAAGDSFENASNTNRLDGYVVTDIRASYGISEGLEIFGRIENLFDAQYETAFLYGQPGRAVFGGLRYRM